MRSVDDLSRFPMQGRLSATRSRPVSAQPRVSRTRQMEHRNAEHSDDDASAAPLRRLWLCTAAARSQGRPVTPLQPSPRDRPPQSSRLSSNQDRRFSAASHWLRRHESEDGQRRSRSVRWPRILLPRCVVVLSVSRRVCSCLSSVHASRQPLQSRLTTRVAPQRVTPPEFAVRMPNAPDPLR